MNLVERELRQRAFDAGRALKVALDDQPETIIWEEGMLPAFRFLLEHTQQRRAAGEIVSVEQQMSDLVAKFRRPVLAARKRVIKPNSEKEVERMLRGVEDDAQFAESEEEIILL